MARTAVEAGFGNRQTSGLPNVYAQRQSLNVNAEMFGGGAANSFNDLARGTAVAGENLYKVQQERDALEATNLDTEYQREVRGLLYDPESGYLSRQGGNAVGVSKEADERLAELKKQYLERATTQGVRDLFFKSAGRTQESTMAALNRYELSQQQKYRDDTINSRILNNAEKSALFFNSDDEFNRSVQDTYSAVSAAAAANGASPETLLAMQRESASKLYAARAAAMLENADPNTVLRGVEFFNKSRDAGNLTYEHWQKLDNLAKAAGAKAYAQREFSALQGNNIMLSNATADDVFNGMILQESGGKQFDATTGKPIESKAGAIGIAQVMPATAPDAAKLAGLPWDEQRYRTDKDYNLALGKAYYNMLVAKYNDPNIAAIAYNWGMGNLDEHIAKVGDPRKGQIPLGNFIASIPSQEAREYLPKVRGKMAADNSGQIDLTQAQARAAAIEKVAPGAGETLLSLVEKSNRIAKQQQEDYTAQVVQQGAALMAQSNGDISVIPANLRSELVRLGKWDDVAKYSGATDTSILFKLRDLPDEAFASTDLRNFAPYLSREDLLHEQERQKKIQGGDEGFKTFSKSVDNYWNLLNGDEKNTTAQKAQYAIRAEREYQKFVDENKRPPNREETRVMLQTLTLDDDNYGHKRVYQYQPSDTFDVGGVRVEDLGQVVGTLDKYGFEGSRDNIEAFVKNPSFFVGNVSGVPVEQVNAISLQLIANRIPVTPDRKSVV